MGQVEMARLQRLAANRCCLCALIIKLASSLLWRFTVPCVSILCLCVAQCRVSTHFQRPSSWWTWPVDWALSQHLTLCYVAAFKLLPPSLKCSLFLTLHAPISQQQNLVKFFFAYFILIMPLLHGKIEAKSALIAVHADKQTYLQELAKYYSLEI